MPTSLKLHTPSLSNRVYVANLKSRAKTEKRQGYFLRLDEAPRQQQKTLYDCSHRLSSAFCDKYAEFHVYGHFKVIIHKIFIISEPVFDTI